MYIQRKSLMKTVLLIFTGSGIGGVLRYFVQMLFIDLGYVTFPAGTFVVNILGCYHFQHICQREYELIPQW